MAGGILLTVAGIWVLAQVLRGDAAPADAVSEADQRLREQLESPPP